MTREPIWPIFFNKSMQPANIISFQIGKNENGNYVVSMVANREKADALPESNFMALAGFRNF